MKRRNLRGKLLLGPTLLLGGALVIAGCNKSYPDEKAAVDQALTSNDFGTVGASQPPPAHQCQAKEEPHEYLGNRA